ncbi:MULTISPECIES: heme-binding protein [Methylotenera]|uniref:heme-binding protein n=1 Tax=Methylotenera TaxID=359407 RepID=UPI0003645241|nr:MULTISPECIES: heme-binding protein [Methylotenera]
MHYKKALTLLSLCSFNILGFAAEAVESAPIKAETIPTANPARVPAAKGPSLELAVEAAKVAIETCAAEGGQKIGASVVDSAGVLKVLLAADGTSPRGVSSSNNKAVTALQFKKSTSALAEQIKTDKVLADTIAATSTYNARPGGILIQVGNEVIGAIGVGGGKTDEPCALAGLNKIQSRL